MDWQDKLGAGLANMGNTCYFNSVLQAVTHTRPLLRLLPLHQAHSNSSECPLCIFKRHLELALGKARLEPAWMISKMSLIFKKWKLGRQEDAHQFLRYLVQFLLKDNIRDNKINYELIRRHQLFPVYGGILKSTVVCQCCKNQSQMLQNFFDLSLELFECESITECLNRFFRREKFFGANKYFCSNCKQFVVAHKFYRVAQCPSVLTLQLKRFSSNLNKIGKKIRLNFRINLAPFCTGEGRQYQLHSVIVHQGRTCFSGHYYAYVLVGDQWYLMDDSRVTKASPETVAQDLPYILLYQSVQPVQTQPQPREEKQPEPKPDPKPEPKASKQPVEIEPPALKLQRSVSKASMVSMQSLRSLSGKSRGVSRLSRRLNSARDKCLLALSKRNDRKKVYSLKSRVD